MAEQAGLGPELAAAIAGNFDAGLGLDVQDYVDVLAAAEDEAALQLLNAGAAAAAPRVVVPAQATVVTKPSLMERYLITPGRRGVIVLLSKLLLVAVHEVWRVVCLPGPVPAVRVATMQRAADSTIVVVTEMPHLFSGAKQLATLSGLPGGLDGHYPIWASDRRKSQTRFSTKLPQLDEGTWQAVQQAVADGGVFVSEMYVLDTSWLLCHLMVVDEAAAPAAAAGGLQAAAAAAPQAAAGVPVAAPAGVDGELVEMLGWLPGAQEEDANLEQMLAGNGGVGGGADEGEPDWP
ncbi:hypothetical protein COHA_000627 [Chlorella ohadii]|uniref:Uncharacterized protein n=1 Tax=Chlorella ohadii TaxID=2649997 RepID=A0AAD5E2V5_9CHLO|nr:hypothetical protein COHA_000627 [Chlorella ohadii]